jgi:hypothetical protein
MKHTSLLFTSALTVLLAASGTAQAVDPARQGAMAVPANRIVGLWVTEGLVRPCGTTLPATPVYNTLLFNAGGTTVENPRVPPGTPRSFGIGTWNYDPVADQYSLHLRFDVYVAGAYAGYQVVDRQMTLSPDGMHVTGEVVSTRYAADGTVLAAVCGAAVSDRA